MKELGKDIYKVPSDERERLRLKFVNQANFYMSHRNQCTNFDIYVSNVFNETKLVLKNNSNFIVTQVDKY